MTPMTVIGSSLTLTVRPITLASLPYMIMLSLLCYLLYFVPQMALWLPATMK